jgi:hypothetical protein
LPIVNIKATNPTVQDPFDGFDWISTGYIAGTGGTTSNTNWLEKNFVTTNINNPVGTQQPYITDLKPDYISFSSSATNYGSTSPQNDDINEVMLNILYGPSNGGWNVIDFNGDNKQVNNLTDNYIVQIRIKNGYLYPIDLLNIQQWRDVRVTTGTSSTSSIDRLNKSVPFNIVLWKKFLTSDENNWLGLTNNILLPAGVNSIPEDGEQEGNIV